MPRSVVKATAAPPVAGGQVLQDAMAVAGRGRKELEREMAETRKAMKEAAARMEFEAAAKLRDHAKALEQVLLAVS